MLNSTFCVFFGNRGKERSSWAINFLGGSFELSVINILVAATRYAISNVSQVT